LVSALLPSPTLASFPIIRVSENSDVVPGEFDQKGNKRTNWGSKEELLQAVKVAKDKGIISYM
jgi:alpha-amylase